MSSAPETTRKTRRKRTQRWGPRIRELREAKGWSRTALQGRYQKQLEERNPDFDFEELLSDAWLSRAERGQSVIYTREHIEVLCDALECTSSQRVEILIAADLNVFADINGDISFEGAFCLRALSYLLNRKDALCAIQKYSTQNDNNGSMIGGEKDIEALYATLQTVLEEPSKSQEATSKTNIEQNVPKGVAFNRAD
jgi:transcriptional regulator with XRE-family HTH domain